LEEPDAADLASLALGPKAAATIREDAMTMRSIPDDDARAMRELIAELLGAKADLLVRLERTAAEDRRRDEGPSVGRSPASTA
jgi:hypothetical protein